MKTALILVLVLLLAAVTLGYFGAINIDTPMTYIKDAYEYVKGLLPI